MAASGTVDAHLARAVLEELGIPHVLVDDGVEAMQALCRRRPRTYSAIVVGERVGRVSGLTGWPAMPAARFRWCS